MHTYKQSMVLIFATCFLVCGQVSLQGQVADLGSSEAKATMDARMAWFREARFGMFIHWGLYAIPGGEWKGKRASGTGEWIMRNAEIPVADYEPLKEQWNPVKFDARAWAKAAKGAGMKYIVITTKHHDGFALFDSAVSDWDVGSAPNKKDIMADIAAACRAEGLKIGWYHSILDWHHPDYLPRRPVDKRPTDTANYERFIVYLKAQLKELLTHYGTIDMLWFDGEWENWNRERGWDMYNYLLSISPTTIINNRVGGGRNDMQGMDKGEGYAGDFGTPEQEIPPQGLPGVDWESCMTMNGTWGWRTDDKNWKSANVLIRNLVDCASKGGNYLLNVGPTPEGDIPPESLERLAAIGRWTQKYGESIYGTKAGPFTKPLAFGRCTQRATEGGTRLYIQVFDWPQDGTLLLPRLAAEPVAARLLAGDGNVGVALTADGIRLTVPKVAPDADASVIVLDCKGTVSVLPWRATAGTDGSILMEAADATLKGPQIRLESQPPHVGYWLDATATVSWPLETKSAGSFDVEVTYAAAPANGGGTFAVQAGSAAALPHTTTLTKGWLDFRKDIIGTVTLLAGATELRVSITDKPREAVLNLRSIRLVPKL